MKIAFVAQPFDVVPPVRGGSIGIWVDEVSRRLAARHDVTVYSQLDAGQPASEEILGVRHERVPTDLDRSVIRAVERAQSLARRIAGREVDLFHRFYYFRPVYHLDYIRKVARLCREQDPDAIVVPNFSQFVPALRRQNPRSRIALVMQCDWLIQLGRRVVESRLRKLDVVTGCSRYIAEGVAARFPDHAAKCHAVYNASDAEHFGIGPETAKRGRELRSRLGLDDRRVILFTGRVCPEKGVHVLLESMRAVAEQVPEAVLLVVGGFSRQPPEPRASRESRSDPHGIDALRADYRGRVEALARELGQRVRLVGAVPHRELLPYYAMADLFVHPSLWNEPFGMILTEAMASGCPVVSTRAGGIPEVVEEGETGLLAEPGDPDSLARAIVELARDEGRRKAMGARGRRRVGSRFTWENTAEGLEAALAPAPPRDPESDAPAGSE